MTYKRIAHICIALTMCSLIYSVYLRIQITILDGGIGKILYRLDRHDEKLYTLEKRIK